MTKALSMLERVPDPVDIVDDSLVAEVNLEDEVTGYEKLGLVDPCDFRGSRKAAMECFQENHFDDHSKLVVKNYSQTKRRSTIYQPTLFNSYAMTHLTVNES
jgi:hypothetical protein